MISKLIASITLLIFGCANSQQLQPLEPIKNHYKTLKLLSSKPNPAEAYLDSIAFPPEEYQSGSLIYVLAAHEYLMPGQVKELKNSITFPSNSSEQTRAELDFLLDWQYKRTPAQEQRAADVLAPIGYWPHISLLKDHQRFAENINHLFYIGRAVMGKYCNSINHPATTKLLEGITKDMRIMEFTVKYHLLRARPYHLESKLRPLARIASPSFASGHTLWAYIQAFTWSELIPDKRKDFLAIAYEIGESREIMGIHYPSDEEAARVLAHKMLSAMWNNPKFKTDLEKAKLEWKK